MKREAGGGWFVLVVDRLDTKRLMLDRNELLAIPPQDLAAIESRMGQEGISPVRNENGEWSALDFRKDFLPYSVPQSIRELAKYIPGGTVITIDNGCLPTIEWRFNGATVEVLDC